MVQQVSWTYTYHKMMPLMFQDATNYRFTGGDYDVTITDETVVAGDYTVNSYR